MKKLKIGIIGVGRLGYEHACNIANRVPGSELVAIADANFDRAKQVAEELGVTAVYNDPKALCADPNVEAVADTSVIFAFFWNSGMDREPQLHMVERTLLRVRPRLSFSEPAYGT